MSVQVVNTTYGLVHFARPIDKMVFKTLGKNSVLDGYGDEFIYLESDNRAENGTSVIKHKSSGGNFVSLANVSRNNLSELLAVTGGNVLTGDKKISLVAGTIRNTGAGWGALDDSLHSPINIQSVEVVTAPEDFKLLINHSVEANNLPDEKSVVISLVAVPDETFATLGLQIGASVGTASSALRASCNLSFRTYGRAAIADVSGFFTNKVSIASLANNTGFRATVPQLQDKVVTVVERHTDARSVDYSVNIVNDKSFDVIAYCELDAYCFYDGSVFQFTTSNVLSILSASWSGDTLTVTHDSCGKSFLSAFVSSVWGGYTPKISAISPNSFAVKFVNDAGVLQTSLSTAFKFYFSRPHKYPCLMPDTESLYLNCGNALVYWGDVVSASGNIWVYGVIAHEKI